MNTLLKRLASKLPPSFQSALKRLNYSRQIRRGSFVADEPEAAVLHTFVAEGDWVIDVGANVGHYTLALSKLVGSRGRVLAFEPIRGTFAHLAANVDFVGLQNVTLINAAATGATAILGMDMPKVDKTGLDNPYMAQISSHGEIPVLGLRIDCLDFPQRISVVKIDAEGHELDVLKGMDRLLRASKPTLIIEGDDEGVERFLSARGYSFSVLPGSWNRIFRCEPAPALEP